MTYDEVEARLTAPGAPFALAEQDAGGRRLRGPGRRLRGPDAGSIQPGASA
jgi:hypothetical protein